MTKHIWKDDKANNKWPDEILNVLIDKSLQPIDFTGKDRLSFLCPIHGEVSRRLDKIYEDLNEGITPKCPKCSRLGATEKVKQTNLERYGTVAPAQNKDVLDKMKQTNLERYGVETVGANKDFQEKIKKSNREKYGVDYVILNQEIKEKANQVMIEKYGTIHALQNEDSMNKFRDTMNERYGSDYTLQNDELHSKMKQTMVDTYGSEHALCNDEIKERMHQTIQAKYGVDYASQTYESYVNTQKSKGKSITSEENFNILKSKDLLSDYIDKLWEDDPLVTLRLVADSLGFAVSTTGHYIIKYELQDKISYLAGTSYGEYEIIDFLDEFNIDYNHRYSKLGPEMDIYIPNHDLGIEFNGLYWHSDIYKDKKYHLKKTKYYNEIGIKLIHIYEDEWYDDVKRNILKSLILSSCNVSINKTIEYARKLNVVELDHKPATLSKIRNFYNENHLQGYRDASIHIALVDENFDIIECMSFGYPYYGNKNGPNYHYELIRHCTKMFHNVVGGKERIFKYFINHYPYNNTFKNYTVSYCDIDKFSGKSYEELGFTLINHSIQVWGIEDNYTRRVNRNPSDNEYFKSIPKIYGCGNNTYVYTND